MILKNIKIIYIFVITIFIVSLFSILYFKNNSNPDFTKKIDYCFNIEKNIDFSVSCLEDVYEETLNDDKFIDLYNYLQEIATEEKSEKYHYLCHRAAHNVGGMIVEKLGGVTNSLKLLNKPACGLIHAPYDYFGREKHSFSNWVELVKDCSKKQRELGYYIQCDDAVGHSVVQSNSKYKEFYNDDYFSYKVCATFEDVYARINCGEGVVMERFGPLDPNVKPEAFISIESLIDQCLSIPSNILNAKEGCSYGVGWYLTMFYLEEVKISHKKNDFSDLLSIAKKDCSYFKSSLNELCFDRFKKLITF